MDDLESVPEKLVVSGITSEPGLNGTYLRQGLFQNSKTQWMKPGSRCYVRWIRDRWEIYVSHHPSGTTYFFHSDGSASPPASGWTATDCALPDEVPKVMSEHGAGNGAGILTNAANADQQLAVPLLLWWNNTCPFVQRVSIALLELGIDAQKQEADIHGSREDAAFAAAFRRACPDRSRRPAIPVLEHMRVEQAGARHATVSLMESQIIVEYLDDEFRSAGRRLLPAGAAQRARLRLFLSVFERSMMPCEADLFAARTQDEYATALGKLDDALRTTEAGLKMYGDDVVPFCDGRHFGFVEVICAPFLQRLATLMPRFRNFSVLERAGKLPRFLSWISAVLDRPSVVNTYDLEAVAEVKSRAVATLEEAESFSQRRANAVAVLQAKLAGNQLPIAKDMAPSNATSSRSSGRGKGKGKQG